LPPTPPKPRRKGHPLDRVRWNVYWGRTHGWRHLVEEHDWNPLVTVPRHLRKAAWRLRHGVAPGSAVPVFLVGAQRSGTNMMVHGLDSSPEFEVYNEGNSKAFEDFRLRDDDQLRRLVGRSRHEFVLFKPLCDTHRILHLLEMTSPHGRGLWAYRDYEGRVRSHVRKFVDSNLRVLQAFVLDDDRRHWQVQGMSAEAEDFVRSFDVTRMTPASASALFWWFRNRIYLDQGISDRNDVLLVSYNLMLDSPDEVMRGICGFLGFPFDRQLVAHMAPRPAAGSRQLPIDDRIRNRCDALQSELDRLAVEQMHKAVALGPAR
jgi:hypothetical protein